MNQYIISALIGLALGFVGVTLGTTAYTVSDYVKARRRGWEWSWREELRYPVTIISQTFGLTAVFTALMLIVLASLRTLGIF